ncbi:MAG: AbrB/MazE/SpoVT family DNA-binding domain-containing protein [Patescibacteria group bacterium]
MIYNTTLTQKGRVTIPIEIRKKLDIKPFEKVTFSMTNNQVVLTQAKNFLSFKGSVKSSRTYSPVQADKTVLKLLKEEYEKKLRYS